MPIAKLKKVLRIRLITKTGKRCFVNDCCSNIKLYVSSLFKSFPINDHLDEEKRRKVIFSLKCGAFFDWFYFIICFLYLVYCVITLFFSGLIVVLIAFLPVFFLYNMRRRKLAALIRANCKIQNRSR